MAVTISEKCTAAHSTPCATSPAYTKKNGDEPWPQCGMAILFLWKRCMWIY